MSRRQNHAWTAECDARLRELHAEGRSWAEISAAFGITTASAKVRGCRIGLEPRPLRGAVLQQTPEAAATPVLPSQPPEAATGPALLQPSLEAATGPVPPHLEIIARAPPQRSEGGHPLPAGHPLTWSLLISLTPVLGNPAWPKGENA